MEEEGDYCTPAPPSAHLELIRQRVSLLDVIGEGQFGNVFRGEYDAGDGCQPLRVAVKTCKPDSQTQMGDRFLQEAHIMSQFEHPHIIRLIGVCSGQPTWLLIELAPLGQLRTYLQTQKPARQHLLLYARQLCDALSYLESRRFVHRDIAARNVLVSNERCVKLADFGLSRVLQADGCYYKAGRGKLPIKWMAPESINYRRFTSASDVYMFAVCVWEICTHGVKPFAQLKNSELISRLESGERLPPPPVSLCPVRLYRILLSCWNFQPNERPSFAVLKHLLSEIAEECDDQKTFIDTWNGLSNQDNRETANEEQSNRFSIDSIKEDLSDQVPSLAIDSDLSSDACHPSGELDQRPESAYATSTLPTSNLPTSNLPTLTTEDCDQSNLVSVLLTEGHSLAHMKIAGDNIGDDPRLSSNSNVSTISSNMVDNERPVSIDANRSSQPQLEDFISDSCISQRHSTTNAYSRRLGNSLDILVRNRLNGSSRDIHQNFSNSNLDSSHRKSFTAPNSPASSERCSQLGNTNLDRQRLLQIRLREQHRQSEADSKWLQEEEQQMFGSRRISTVESACVKGGRSSQAMHGGSSYSSLCSSFSTNSNQNTLG